MKDIGSRNKTGSYDLILVGDVETTGLHFNSLNPCRKNDEYYQAVSVGLIVADAVTLEPLDELYIEIKWDGKSIWSDKAEAVHGLSKEHLEANGLSVDEAVGSIVEFVYKWWPPTGSTSRQRNVRMAGHNVGSFDIYFIHDLFECANASDLMFSTGNRYIDTSTIGWCVFDTFTSDQLFNILAEERTIHNSLEDARLSLTALKVGRLANRKNFV